MEVGLQDCVDVGSVHVGVFSEKKLLIVFLSKWCLMSYSVPREAYPCKRLYVCRSWELQEVCTFLEQAEIILELSGYGCACHDMDTITIL